MGHENFSDALWQYLEDEFSKDLALRAHESVLAKQGPTVAERILYGKPPEPSHKYAVMYLRKLGF